jgi:hypothetical protein
VLRAVGAIAFKGYAQRLRQHTHSHGHTSHVTLLSSAPTFVLWLQYLIGYPRYCALPFVRRVERTTIWNAQAHVTLSQVPRGHAWWGQEVPLQRSRVWKDVQDRRRAAGTGIGASHAEPELQYVRSLRHTASHATHPCLSRWIRRRLGYSGNTVVWPAAVASAGLDLTAPYRTVYRSCHHYPYHYHCHPRAYDYRCYRTPPPTHPTAAPRDISASTAASARSSATGPGVQRICIPRLVL